MAFSSTEKLSNADKLSLQIVGTANDSPGAQFWYNEFLGWAPVTPTNKLWADFDTIPGAKTPSEADDAVSAHPTIIEKRKLRLTLRAESNDRAYLARQIYGDNTSDLYENWLQPSLFQVDGGASAGYIIRLYRGDPDSGGVEITTTQHGGGDGSPAWAWDYSRGVLKISTDQRTSFKTYYDASGLWVQGYRYIGSFVSGGGGEVKLRTTESFTMAVNPSTGSSPADGVIITSQAEYDALGAPLKYIQDVFRVLPAQGLDHPIKVNVASGTHLARPGTGGDLSMFCDIPSYASTQQAGGWNFAFGSPYGPGVVFEGAKTSIEAGIAGTLATYSFTRSAGTWTPGALVGKQFDIVSGASAGSSRLVVENTDTVAYFALSVYATGAATIDTWEPGTTFLSSEDGVAPTFYGMLYRFGSFSSNAPIVFRNVQWGNVGLPFGTIQVYGLYLVISESVITRSDIIITPYSEGRTALEITNTHIDLSGTAYGIWLRGPEIRANLNGNLYTGVPSYSLLRTKERSSLYMTGARIIPGVGFSGPCIKADGESWVSLGDDVQIDGNGSCIGLQINGDGTQPAGIDGSIVIRDCGIAVDAGGILLNSYFTSSGSTGNAIGWRVRYGSSITIANPQYIEAGTTELLVDGDALAYADVLGVVGDEIIGAQGSRILRR